MAITTRGVAGALLIQLLTLGAAFASSTDGFQDNPREAFAAARESGKPLLLRFHAVWCEACERMQRTTWQETEVIQRVEQFIPLAIDGERNRNLQTRYAVNAYPTIIVADSEGRTILSLLGFQDGATMTAHLAQVLEHWPQLKAWAKSVEGKRPDVDGLLGLADFASNRQALAHAEQLYRRALGRKLYRTPDQARRAASGLARVLAKTDRCREALKLLVEPDAELATRCP